MIRNFSKYFDFRSHIQMVSSNNSHLVSSIIEKTTCLIFDLQLFLRGAYIPPEILKRRHIWITHIDWRTVATIVNKGLINLRDYYGH